MRWITALLTVAGPIAASAGTHSVGVDIGRASAADMRCPPAEAGICQLKDDAQRVYYEFAPAEAVGFRVTHLLLNELRITTTSDEIFNLPQVSSFIRDISVTYSYPVWKQVVFRGRVGLAQWEESRSPGGVFGLARETSDGLSPVAGFEVDVGTERVRAALSADLYPAVGDTGYVRYFGIGLRMVFGRPGRSRSEDSGR